MQRKVYPQSFKDEVVKFYMTNHTIAETIRKYGIAESTLFEWRKRYDERHYLSTSTSPRLKNWRQKELHLTKIERKLEVLGKLLALWDIASQKGYSILFARSPTTSSVGRGAIQNPLHRPKR